MNTKPKTRKKGINVTVSPAAHTVMLKEAMKSVPRKTLRAVVNLKNNLSENE